MFVFLCLATAHNFFSSFIHVHENFQTLFVYRGIAFLCAYVLHFQYTFINSRTFYSLIIVYRAVMNIAEQVSEESDLVSFGNIPRRCAVRPYDRFLFSFLRIL